MLKYISKRILLMLPVLLGISFAVFLLMYFMPGDPVRLMLGDDATDAQVEQLRETLGLNDGFFRRYFSYIGQILKGDLGTSYTTKMPVWQEIAPRFLVTVKMACFVIVFSSFIGIAMGIISALRRYGVIDSILRIFSLIGITMPSFWLALLLVLFFAVNLKWLPASGLYGAEYYILPVISISAASVAIISRTSRSAMLEVVNQDYINTARAKGLAESKVLFKHALRNAIIPILTVIGIQFSGCLGGAVVNEQVFAIPGIGKLMVDAIRARNYPLVTGTVLVLTLLQSAVNLFIDILYAAIDPRIRTQYAKKQKGGGTK